MTNLSSAPVCRLFHKWGPWQYLTLKTTKHPSYRTRDCDRCGKYQMRRV